MGYDLIIIGSGIAGATLAKRLAAAGMRILVLERETCFRDRVRGEGLLPWGVAEAHALGIYDLLANSCGHLVQWWNHYSGQREPSQRRNLLTTCPQALPALSFYHPEMQEILLGAAHAAGAEIWRGARALAVTPAPQPQVTIERNGQTITVLARLVVCAAGRSSILRLPGAFAHQAEIPQSTIAGLLYTGLAAPRDTVSLFVNPRSPGHMAVFFPLSKRRHRVYLVYPTTAQPRPLSGYRQVPLFQAACQALGVPPAWFVPAVTAGPLAAYPAAAKWVELPYYPGIVLVGDAAGAPNPSFGCGLSLALRDVRVLSDGLLAAQDWEGVGRHYAHTHADYFARLHAKETWMTTLFFSQGPAANRRRAFVMGLHAKEPDRDLDMIGTGPDERYDERARQRFFGEDLEQPATRAG